MLGTDEPNLRIEGQGSSRRSELHTGSCKDAASNGGASEPRKQWESECHNRRDIDGERDANAHLRQSDRADFRSGRVDGSHTERSNSYRGWHLVRHSEARRELDFCIYPRASFVKRQHKPDNPVWHIRIK